MTSRMKRLLFLCTVHVFGFECLCPCPAVPRKPNQPVPAFAFKLRVCSLGMWVSQLLKIEEAWHTRWRATNSPPGGPRMSPVRLERGPKQWEVLSETVRAPGVWFWAQGPFVDRRWSVRQRRLGKGESYLLAPISNAMPSGCLE